MATAKITRRQRTATPERWQAALRRALAEEIEVRQLAGSGAWVATSGSDAATAYEVSQFGCSCPADEFGDPVCKHRAAYWHAVGVLDLDPDPEPPTPAAPAVPVPTRRCSMWGGSGQTIWTDGNGWPRIEACPFCAGSGLRPAPVRVPADATAAKAVALIERRADAAPDEPADLLAA